MAGALVIEDDDANREMFRLLLQDAGFEVSEAANGEVGLALLYDAPQPLVVLLDRLLPALDGGGLLSVVATDARLLRHRYVLVTASPHTLTPIERELLAELGIAVLAKPFDIARLLQAVERAAGSLP